MVLAGWCGTRDNTCKALDACDSTVWSFSIEFRWATRPRMIAELANPAASRGVGRPRGRFLISGTA